MPRFLMAWILSLGANAIALVLCWIFVSGFNMTFTGFIVALIVFAILSALFSAILMKILRKHAAPMVALTGIISTFLALLVTTWITSGLTIDGFSAWIIATLLIWVISMVIWVIPGPWRSHERAEERRS